MKSGCISNRIIREGAFQSSCHCFYSEAKVTLSLLL